MNCKHFYNKHVEKRKEVKKICMIIIVSRWRWTDPSLNNDVSRVIT